MTKRAPIILAFLVMLCCFNNLNAQLFSLDSIILQQIRKDRMPDALKYNENKSRFPILVSQDLITLFHLKDTLIDGLQVNYFTSRQEMANKYSLKETNKTFQSGSIYFVDANESKIKIQMNYGIFKCDKWLFRDGIFLISNNGIFIIEYLKASFSQGTIIISEISH